MEITGAKPSQMESIELILAKLLRIGSLLAAGLMGAGTVAMLAGLTGGTVNMLMTAGIVVLVFTPIMRVVVAGVVFLRERDYLFSLFCAIVVAALAVGMLIGKVE